MEFFFMIFGLGFFLFAVHYIVRTEERDYQRRISEAREFGFGEKNQHTARTLRDKWFF